MSAKSTVRIIKGNPGEAGGKDTVASITSQRATEHSVRDIAATVSTWVREFQQRRRVNPKQAFAGLFKEQILHPDRVA